MEIVVSALLLIRALMFHWIVDSGPIPEFSFQRDRREDPKVLPLSYQSDTAISSVIA